MRLLIDTNIFLDILFCREGFYEGSKKLFYTCYKNKDQTFVNASSLKDIYYFAFKSLHNKKDSLRIVHNIYNNMTKVIDCSADDAIGALFEDGDYEDNMLRQSSLRTMCDAIITRNIKDFSKQDIPCLTPEEYLKYR